MNEEAFLEAIVDHPDEDAPRLIFADWLEERGQSERAEFIRLQIRLAQTPEYERFYQEIYHGRRKDFYGGSFKNTLPALPAGLEWPPLKTFRRGLPWGFTVRTADVATFLRHAPRLFTQAPIQHLELDGRAEDFAEQIPMLAESPWLSRLRSLEIQLGRLGAKPITQLCESPHLERLECLALTFGGIDQSGAEALVHSSLFPRLAELSLAHTDYGAPVGPVFATTVADFDKPCRLRKLNLEMNRLGPGSAARLAESPALTSLTHLNLNRCSYGFMLHEVGYQVLSESPYLSGIEVLDVALTEPQLGGIQALTTSPTWRKLRALNLADNRLGPKAGQMIASSPVLANLTILDLHGNNVGDKTAGFLAHSPYLTRLFVLNLRQTNLTDVGAQALLNSPNLDGVVHLDVASNSLSDRMKLRLRGWFGKRLCA